MILELLKYEETLYNKGIKLIAGIDEVGRGPIAGPFVACAVILNIEKIFKLHKDVLINNDAESQKLDQYKLIDDSKKLTEKKRLILSDFVKSECISYSMGEVSVEELDAIGIGKTTQKAFEKALSGLSIMPDYILTDAFPLKSFPKEKQLNIIKGDSKSITIAAASIVAKVYRDEFMRAMHTKFPHYGFDKNKGYGTKDHLEAINKFGICELHRKCFEPIKSRFSNS